MMTNILNGHCYQPYIQLTEILNKHLSIKNIWTVLMMKKLKI